MAVYTKGASASTSNVRDAALRAYGRGLSVLPPHEDGSKSPLAPGGTWKRFQVERASLDQLHRWYGERTGLGAVTGSVSRGLSLLEFDCRETYLKFKEAAAALGLAEMVERIEAGYLEDTPGGGVHWLAFCEGGRECTKLARRHKTPDEYNDSDRQAVEAAREKGRELRPVKTLIETKDEGGYVVLAPSNGKVHPSGGAYRLLRGGFETIATVTPAELASLWDLARSFDRMPEPEPTGTKKHKGPAGNWGDTVPPWEDYNARTTWPEVLPAGWAMAHQQGETQYWRRAGKERGHSATINHNGSDRLYVFSSSTEFAVQKPHSRFDVYALLNHGGDSKAAFKALSERGYGTFMAWVWDREKAEWRSQTHPNPCPPGGFVRIAKQGGGPPPPPRGSQSQTKAGSGAKPVNGDDAKSPFIVEAGSGTKPGANETIEFGRMSDADLGIVPLNTVKEGPVFWLWKYRLERGGLALLAGNAGVGKSQVLFWIATAVTTGGPWPDGSGNAPLGNVVIVSAEDRPDRTIKPRLIAMGADIDRVTIIKARYVVKKKGQPDAVHFATFSDLAYWKEVLGRIPDLILFLVDPVPSYLGRGVNDSKNIEIRAILEPFLHMVIEPRDICMLGDTHLNKSADIKTPLHRISGSIAYGALPRNVHFALRDPDDPARRYLKQEKCNDAPDDLPALAFKVERREIVNADGEVIETAIPVFEAETVTIDTGAMVNGVGPKTSRRGPDPTKTTEVAEWLFDLLAEEVHPMLWAAIADAAGAKGFVGERDPDTGYWMGKNALYRALDKIPELVAPRDGKRVETLKMQRDGRGRIMTYWQLVDRDAAF